MNSDNKHLQNKETDQPQFPFGPSPWAFVNQTVYAAGSLFRFEETTFDKNGSSGLIYLQSTITGAILLILDFYCYLRILDDGTALLWHKTESGIAFDCFSLLSLEPLANPIEITKVMREAKLNYSPLSISEHWEISRHLSAEKQYSLDCPYDWSNFGELLVLADLLNSSGLDRMDQAILAFDWLNKKVEAFPQDWFNQSDYDFGYQWITRVARRSDGLIIGDGIRLGIFELDETNRRIKKWLVSDHFYFPFSRANNE